MNSDDEDDKKVMVLDDEDDVEEVEEAADDDDEDVDDDDDEEEDGVQSQEEDGEGRRGGQTNGYVEASDEEDEDVQEVVNMKFEERRTEVRDDREVIEVKEDEDEDDNVSSISGFSKRHLLLMSYIPPHRRHGNGTSLTPTSLAPIFNRSLGLRSLKADRNKPKDIIYADHAVNEWFAIGLGAVRVLSSLVPFKFVSVDAVERGEGMRCLTLISDYPTEYGEAAERSVESPWSSIAKLVLPHLISSFPSLKSVDGAADGVEVKPVLVARFGEIIFHGSCNMRVEDASSCVSASSLKSLKRTFYTNVPSAYVKEVTDGVVPRMGLETGDEKDVYHVKISDKLRPDEIISCKCRLSKEEQKLEIYKVGLNAVRHMVVDISCLEKDLDLRLMICAKRTIKALSEEELTAITDLVGSAIVDRDANGGLRWPLGKNSSGSNRYSVVEAWHMISKYYRNSTLELKVRQADRFNFRLSSGEATHEVNLKMRKIASALGELNPEAESIREMLEESLKLIWEYFLGSRHHPEPSKVASV